MFDFLLKLNGIENDQKKRKSYNRMAITFFTVDYTFTSYYFLIEIFWLDINRFFYIIYNKNK